MKYLLILSCLLFTSVGWSKDVSMDDLEERVGLYYEKFKGDPFTGKVTGQKQGKISKGKKEGEWIWYYENGQLSSKSNYKDGKEDGEWLWYHSNGQLQTKVNYIDGREDGEDLHYYESGQLQNKSNYIDGKLEGEVLTYYENGQ